MNLGEFSARLPKGDLWVFGYGSLMWSPCFDYKHKSLGRAHGYHRALCILSTRYRGTQKKPGLVMGLCRGGSCWGMAYRIDAPRLRHALARLWYREMPRRVYEPRLIPVKVKNKTVRALAFVADPAHPAYVRELDLHGRARLVAQGIGIRGLCIDYIRHTLDHMHDVGVRDPHLERILQAALALRQNGANDPNGKTAELWPARLHHLRRDSPKPEPLARFYGELLGDRVAPLPDGSWLVAGRNRRLVVGRGNAGAVPYFALELQDAAHLAEYRKQFGNAERFTSPLFQDAAFAVTDPDGRRVVFGVPREEPPANGLPARLQHFVCATQRLPQMLEFYRGLGMAESDRVLEGEELSAVFLRSDPEHHSFAAFRAPESRPDHHCYETTGWLDIRDWGDRMAKLRIPLWWGPGRHGPGNNLFFMIEDPDGHKVEFSAELELLPKGTPHRTWPHEQRTLNLWGSAWMRS